MIPPLVRRMFATKASYARDNFLKVSDEVKTALDTGTGVVALETTVITHGLPYPKNIEVALEVDKVIRDQGCTPASVGILDGQIRVGLTILELEKFAKAKDAAKVSRRDISRVLSKGGIGGTTVSGTMFGANQAGIEVFATGGIGGVHRGVAETWDVSGDLRELGRTPVTVVCAGAKSILDVGKTLEYLETEGVPVVTYCKDGNSEYFPGFFTTSSGYRSPFTTDSLDEIIRMIRVSEALGLNQGMLVACPIPKEGEASGELIEQGIQQSLREARERKIQGRDVTPFVLKRLNDLTTGESLSANLMLLKNNARVGAELAKRLADEKRNSKGEATATVTSSIPSSTSKALDQSQSDYDVTVIGGCNVDYYVRTSDPQLKYDGGSYEGTVVQLCGGVGRNHADALARLGLRVGFISAIGDDTPGHFVQDYCSHMDMSHVARTGKTSTYAAVLKEGDVLFGVQSPMHLGEIVTPSYVTAKEGMISQSKLLLLDGNLSVDTIRTACTMASYHNVPIWYEPADKNKLKKIFEAESWDKISYISPNVNECLELFFQLRINIGLDQFKAKESLILKLKQNNLALKALEHLKLLIVTMGPNGALIMENAPLRKTKGSSSLPKFESLSIEPLKDPVSTSGAGDCFNSGLIAGMLAGKSLAETVPLAVNAAVQSLRTQHPVPRDFSMELLTSQLSPQTIASIPTDHPILK